jgi:SAM-dependent methyltransferase
VIPARLAECDPVVRVRRRILDLRHSRPAIVAARLRHRGERFHCPCCNSDLEDMRDRFGENRVCWACGSMERHRLVCLWFDRSPELFSAGMSLLHVAPERSLLPRLQAVPGIRYTGGDLGRVFSSVRIDVTDLAFPDASFDAVICNHVLEHVPDDRRAMREIRRVLKPGGWALLLVPDVVEHGDVTDEDPSVTAPVDRLARFGQEDHVRVYGWDYVERLAAAGLDVDVVRLERELDADTIERCRLQKFGLVEPLFVARG